MAVANLVINVAANTTGFSRGLSKGRGDLKTFTASVKNAQRAMSSFIPALAGGFTAGAFVKGIRDSINRIDELGKTASKLGVGTAALGGLQHAANQTGVATATLNMAMQRMVRRVSEAAKGTGEAKDAIKELGLDAAALAALSPDQQMFRIADAMSKVGSQGDRVRLAMKLFDSEGVSLVNTLALGSKGMQDMISEAKRLGIAVDENVAKQAAAANDAIDRMTKSLQGMANSIMSELAPAITAIADGLQSVFAKGGWFNKAQTGLMMGLADATAAILGEEHAAVQSMRDSVAARMREFHPDDPRTRGLGNNAAIMAAEEAKKKQEEADKRSKEQMEKAANQLKENYERMAKVKEGLERATQFRFFGAGGMIPGLGPSGPGGLGMAGRPGRNLGDLTFQSMQEQQEQQQRQFRRTAMPTSGPGALQLGSAEAFRASGNQANIMKRGMDKLAKLQEAQLKEQQKTNDLLTEQGGARTAPLPA